jgi:hypothetical protein
VQARLEYKAEKHRMAVRIGGDSPVSRLLRFCWLTEVVDIRVAPMLFEIFRN